MSDQFVGEIRIFGFNFAPSGWAFCQGQLLPISQNAALFSLLGTNYGGDGRQTFALPNLQGNIPVNQGQGVGLSTYIVGQVGGSATVTLTSSEMPAHTHTLPASPGGGRVTTPSPSVVLAATSRGEPEVYASTSTGDMSTGNLGSTGGSQPHNNVMPYLVLSYCIALQGIYPARS